MRGLTIGQAAAYVGVTVKTVRHYHRVGLLDEPQRDTSGYRRYSSADLLRLVRIRALAGAGVALAEIDGVLDADPARLAAAVGEAERRVDDRIAALVAQREALRRVADGDRALLPERACALLDRHAGLGFPPDFVAEQRDGLVLVRAVAPGLLDGYLTLLELRLGDPEYVALQKRGWEAATWSPDDPRIDDLAAALAANLLVHRELMEEQAGFFATPDAVARYRLIDDHRAEELPALARLNALVAAHLRSAGLSVPRR